MKNKTYVFYYSDNFEVKAFENDEAAVVAAAADEKLIRILACDGSRTIWKKEEANG